VDHGETGLLVTPETLGPTEVEPRHPEQFARDLAAAVNTLLDDPDLRHEMARKARERVERLFSWTAIATRTLQFYEDLVARHARERG
jgi:starch synthase